MSIKVMSLIWAAPIKPTSLKLVALAMADRADDSGGSLYLSIGSIARKVGVSHSQAQRLVKNLKAAGLLRVVSHADGGSRTTPRYRLQLDVIAGLGNGVDSVPDTAWSGSTDATPGAAPMRSRGRTDATQTTKESSLIQGVQSPTESELQRSNNTTLRIWLASLEEGTLAVPPTDPIFDYAHEIGLPNEYLALAWHAFKTKYLEDQPDKRYRDWRAVFRRAVREDWLRLWYAGHEGNFSLTTRGLQLQRLQTAEGGQNHV